jgi:hypothetical protein
MPNVIDSLVILLDLDPSKFNEGQKKALDQLKKTKDSAAGTAKDLESSGKQAAAFFDHIASSAPVRKQAAEQGASPARTCAAEHLEALFSAVDQKPHTRPRLTVHDGGKPAA